MADGAREQYPEDFLTEAREIVQGLSDDVLALEQSSSSGALEPDTLQRIFRAAHTLKGLAGMFGASAVASLAHALEDLLDALRLGQGQVTREVLDLLFETPGVLESLLSGQPSDESAAELAGRLRAMSTPQARRGVPPPPYELPQEILEVLSEYEIVRLHEAARRHRRLCGVRCSIDVDRLEEDLREIKDRLGVAGEVVSAVPIGSEDPLKIDFDILVASDVPAAGLGQTVGAVAQEYPPIAAEPQPVEQAPSPPLVAGGTVRVEIRQLDELLTIVGELGVTRSTLARLAERLQAEPGLASYGLELNREVRALERRLRTLREGVLEARLVPLGPLFARMARVIRGLAREAGCEVKLSSSGGETEVDKLMVELVSDPLIQLLRNAVDHGIEAPEVRAGRGKPDHGQIFLHAQSDGNRVTIHVRDDGGGIDLDRVRRAGVERGLCSVEDAAALTEREVLALLFVPGFTTRPEVGEISGRGVGLDVVKTNITRLSGKIHVDTEPGVGTTFSLTLPVTLAILPSLLVRAGGETLAVPVSAVVEATLTPRFSVDGAQMSLRGEELPALVVADRLGFPRRSSPDLTVVVNVAEQSFALLVEDVLGQHDMVVKPLGALLGDVPGIAGVAELAEGNLSLVLDLASLVSLPPGA